MQILEPEGGGLVLVLVLVLVLALVLVCPPFKSGRRLPPMAAGVLGQAGHIASSVRRAVERFEPQRGVLS